MIKIGHYNKLHVSRLVDFGAYLTDGSDAEVLLPARYITEPLNCGDEVEVFVYTDSEDRPVATTEHPYATVGEFAFLDVASTNRIGAFLDWGLMKDLLVPFSQQKTRMHQGRNYLVYVYLDDATKRVVASAKIEKFLGNVIPNYRIGDKVEILIYKQTPIGYACIVDNLHHGMLYENQLYRPVEIGEKLEAYVVKCRPDGKIDVTLSPKAKARTSSLADRILEIADSATHTLPLDDKSSPEAIKELLQCSKRDFKQAIGHLLKDGIIEKSADGKLLLVVSNAHM